MWCLKGFLPTRKELTRGGDGPSGSAVAAGDGGPTGCVGENIVAWEWSLSEVVGVPVRD